LSQASPGTRSSRPISIPFAIFVDHLLHELVAPDLVPEGPRSWAYRTDGVEAGLARPDRASRDRCNRPWSIALHGDEEALAPSSKSGSRRDAHVLQSTRPVLPALMTELSLVEGPGQPGHAAPTTNAVILRALRLVDRFPANTRTWSAMSAADPDLVTVEYIVAAVAPGGGLEVPGVRSASRPRP
jgi:hypothetical protein